MPSLFRRAGAEVARIIASAADPAAAANQFRVYSKLAGGIAQLFGRASDGTIYQLTPLADDGWTSLVQLANQDVTNAQDQDSDTLLFPVTPGGTYEVQLDLYASGTNSVNDYEYRFAVTAGTMLGRGISLGINAADVVALTALNAVVAANTNQVPVGTFTGIGSTPTAVSATYSFQPTNNTTFKMQFGNNVTGVGIASRTFAGSRMRWKKIA